MNTPRAWQDEDIHALLDGELDADTARQLEADSQADAALAARIARQREVRRLLHERFDPVLDEAVPTHLRTAAAGVVHLSTARARADASRATHGLRWGAREWGALAASLFLGVLLTSLFLHDRQALPLDVADGHLVATGALDAALARQVSGSATGGAVQVMLSFRSSGGTVCRAFALHSDAASAGLACRRAGRWQVELLEGTRAAPGSGDYRQAASGLPAALRAAVEARGGDEPLTPEEESGQIARGWDPPRP